MKTIGAMLDCSRNAVRSVSCVKKFIDYSKLMRMNRLYLYIEDVYEIEGEPYFGHMRGRYSIAELKEMADYGDKQGVTVVPCFQTLAHLNQAFRWEKYQDILDINDIFLVEDERTYELIDKMFKTMSKAFKCDVYNVGMDEAFMLGHGKYFIKNGPNSKIDLFMKHLDKVNNIAKKYNKKISIWSDMLYRTALKSDVYYETKAKFDEEFIKRIPKDVDLCYWDYYHQDEKTYLQMMRNHKALGNHISFASGVWTWTGFAPSNSYGLKIIKPGIKAALAEGIDDIILTAWGDNGAECSLFSALPAFYYASEIARGNNKMKDIKDGFFKLFGYKFDDFMKLDLPNLLSKENVHINPSKYLIYNDPFLGPLDSTINGSENDKYKAIYSKLKRLSNKLGDFNYLAEYMASLSKFLSYKACLGVNTREAYKKKDVKKLNELLVEYKASIKYLKQFILSFKKAWNVENKPFGFEVQEFRLGGVLLRLENCMNTIKSYLNHEIDNIPELEEKVLDLNGRSGEELRKKEELYNDYLLNSTMNRM